MPHGSGISLCTFVSLETEPHSILYGLGPLDAWSCHTTPALLGRKSHTGTLAMLALQTIQDTKAGLPAITCPKGCD